MKRNIRPARLVWIVVVCAAGCEVKVAQVIPPPIVLERGAPTDLTLEGDYDPIRIIRHQTNRQYTFELSVQPTGRLVDRGSIAVRITVNDAEFQMEKVGDARWRYVYTMTKCDEYLRYKYTVTYKYSLIGQQTVTMNYPGPSMQYDDFTSTDVFMARVNRQPSVSLDPTELMFYCDSTNLALCGPRTVTIINRTRGEIRVVGEVVGDRFSLESGRKLLFTPEPLPFACDETRSFQVLFKQSTEQSEGVLRTFWMFYPPDQYRPLPDIPLSGKVFLF